MKPVIDSLELKKMRLDIVTMPIELPAKGRKREKMWQVFQKGHRDVTWKLLGVVYNKDKDKLVQDTASNVMSWFKTLDEDTLRASSDLDIQKGNKEIMFIPLPKEAEMFKISAHKQVM